ncbi:MAG: hypothetical protein AMK72_01730 [Planctomycetes bacterium SM23_25]|nr:MAG: hypothetical protein AMK72_01730 [Planctomycetes bacterium SM23_25]
MCLMAAAWLALVATASAAETAHPMDPYNVVWQTPSKDSSGSMPLGNGSTGLNAWIEESGDLVFYISRTDSWGDNARLLKVGRVRVTLDPRPSTAPPGFRQTLSLKDATMTVRYGEGQAAVLQLWADANHPVIHVAIDSPEPTTATASIELWRTKQEELPSLEVSDVMLERSKPGKKHGPTVVEPDTVLKNQTGRIGWFHHNVKSVGPAMTGEIQGLEGFERPDPLLGRTFGAVILADKGRRLDDLNLTSPRSKAHRFDIYVVTRHPATPEGWFAAVDETIAATRQTPPARRREAHERWGRDFWDRSWIRATSAGPPQTLRLVPPGTHPVRIGIDQRGGSRFAGEIGRLTLYGKGLSDAAVQRLAKLERSRPPEDQDALLYAGTPQLHAAIDGSKDWTFDKGLAIEAWVKPEKMASGGGRIVDKITPGGSDGFLLDTWPGNSLRFIVGRVTLAKPDVLPAGQWSHVAAVVDPATGKTTLYLNGAPLAQQAVEAGDDAAVVSRAYALQRFITACAGRGAYPIKFNGTIFTVPHPGAPGDADYRRWGPGYWWQNTRLPYISLCASGDFDLMQPLFAMYARDLMPLLKFRTHLYLGHAGAYIPECIYFWGDMFSETYGWTPYHERKDRLQASGYHKWEWVSGPELVSMMLDYYDHTLDEAFLAETLLPAAHEILTFFDQHYGVDERGKLVMHPSQACETWWDCTNPMPELAGLHAATDRLLALPARLTTEAQRAFWTALRKKLPDLPTREVDGKRMLAPAERFASKRNSENPELYAVFPFRRIAIGRPGVELGIEALRHRWDKGNSGWRQDDIFMAYLGLADEARKNLVGRARKKHAGSRFPAFWGPNYDWIPDQDHGGVLMKALQAMLLQTDGRKVFLLPAWPKDWDVHFRLHAPYRTTVECKYGGGKVRLLTVTPPERKADLVTLEPQ